MRGSRREAVSVHRIGEGATFAGEVRFSGRLEIDGTIAGSVIAEVPEGSEVIIGPKGRVQGQITAASIVVSGVVEGPVRSTVRLEINAGARILGDIHYQDLQIQHGALVEGALKPVAGEQVALKLVANSRT